MTLLCKTVISNIDQYLVEAFGYCIKPKAMQYGYTGGDEIATFHDG
jgi:hypothetical protein